MPVNYQQIQSQIIDYAAKASQWQIDLQMIGQQGIKLLHLASDSQAELRDKVLKAAGSNVNLRCALPTSEKMNMVFPLPVVTSAKTVIAADGSQIIPSRHRQVEFGVINISTVSMQAGSGFAPVITVDSDLLDLDLLHQEGSLASEGYIALLRDVAERRVLVRESLKGPQPVVTLTDGGLELYREPKITAAYTEKLYEYLAVLEELKHTGAITAAYVDKPGSGLVMQMLDLAAAPADVVRGSDRFRGFPDRLLFANILLNPGDRSALFQIKSPTADPFIGELTLHFFYFNVSKNLEPDIVRVEVPAWVANDHDKMDLLQACLTEQAWLLANPYPYVLHRAHEEAVVTYEDSGRLEDMIIGQLIKNGMKIGRKSNKQAHKDLAGKRRY
jgi:hypothetical protein